MTRQAQQRTGNLPVDVTSLVGRRSETVEVRKLMGRSRIVTLTGPGGVGKTRLALHVARRSAASFPAGVWFISLAEVPRPELVIPTIMSVLEFGPGLKRELAEQIGDRRLLLVLDNCEHLTESCAEVATALLSACPGLSLLATSRESLRIAGETVFAVRALSVPRPGEEDRSGGGGRRDAVSLFIERAQLANPDLIIDAETERSVVELCRRLDGLPLAIELSAAATRVLPIEALNAQAAHPLTQVAHGLRSAPTRHQSLRATIACSYDLCSASAQRLWERMSVLRGATSIEVVQDVCGDESLTADDIVDALVELTEKSVLEFDGSRYRMLETIRCFGADGLAASGQEAATRAAHLRSVAALADDLEQSWLVGDQERAVRRVREEWANVRAALDHCLVDPTSAGTGLRITRQLFGFWLTSLPMREGRTWLTRFLAVETDPSEDWISVLWVAGLLTTLDGDVTAAERLLRQGVELSRDMGDQANLAHSLQGLGFCYVLRGLHDDAIEVLEEAVDLERSLPGPNPHLSRALTTQGIALCAAERATAATEVLEEARSVQSESGDNFMGSWSDAFLGLATCLDGQLDRAEDLLRMVLERKLALGDALGVSLTLEFLAWVALEKSEPERGAWLLGASDAVAQQVGPHLVGFARLLQWHADYGARAMKALGTRAFESALRRSLGLSVPEMVAHALGMEDRETPPADDVASDDVPLTRRERQIALLVAEGKTNKEIAAELVIAHRTVDSHVENILVKLDFSSRAQIAALIAKQSPTSVPPSPAG